VRFRVFTHPKTRNHRSVCNSAFLHTVRRVACQRRSIRLEVRTERHFPAAQDNFRRMLILGGAAPYYPPRLPALWYSLGYSPREYPASAGRVTATNKNENLHLNYFEVGVFDPTLAPVGERDVLPAADLIDDLHLATFVKDEQILTAIIRRRTFH
jgi:hypothetical protein